MPTSRLVRWGAVGAVIAGVVIGLAKRPEKPHADKAYDDKECAQALKRRMARKKVVKRTLAWVAKYRRLTTGYDRRDDIHEAFLHLGCSLIYLNT